MNFIAPSLVDLFRPGQSQTPAFGLAAAQVVECKMLAKSGSALIVMIQGDHVTG